MRAIVTRLFTALMLALGIGLRPASAQNPLPVPVSVDNYVRAETHFNMAGYVKQGAFGRFLHFRQMTDVENQIVIRMNFDALYSLAVLDLTTPAMIYLPDPGRLFQSLMCISDNHSIPTTRARPRLATGPSAARRGSPTSGAV